MARLTRFLVLIATVGVLACIPKIPGVPGQPDNGYSIVLESLSEDGGVITLPNGKTDNVVVVVRDRNGVPAVGSVFEISWSADDGSIVSVAGTSLRAGVTCEKDFFDQATLVVPDAGPGVVTDPDAGADDGGASDAGPVPDAAPYWVGTEPETKLTASYRGSSSSLQIVCVVDVSGKWHVQLDDGTSTDVTFTQSGRTVKYQLYGLEGDIHGNSFSFSAFGTDAVGALSSRTQVSGTYVNHSAGTSGTWSGYKK